MKTGHTPSRSVPDYWDRTTIPWFTLADVWQLRDGQQIYLGETVNRISELGLANSAAELLPVGTVVLSRTASVGFSGVMRESMATSQDFWNWICGPDLLPEYLNYQFKAIAPQLRALNMGSTHQTIYQKDAAGIEILVPPLDEQRAIIDYLDHETARIDELIFEQRRLVALLQERRVAVAAHAIQEHADQHEYVDKLGRHARIGNGSTPRRDKLAYWNGGTYPWLNSAVVNRARVVSADQFVTDAALSECHLPVVPPGSVLVGLTGQGKTRGMATILEIEATVSQHIAYITPDPARWSPAYLLWSLTASYNDLRRRSDENGSTKGGLTCENLKQFRIATPPLEDQARIATYLNEQTQRIETLSTEAERLVELAQERRTALIAAAVTGQVNLRSVA